VSAPRPLALLVLGGLLGFSLSRIGFSSYDEVHAMFTFADLRLFLTFLGGVTLLGAALYVVRRVSSPAWPARPIERGTLLGGVVFGAGWALCGACPGVAVVQLGEGKLYALVTLAGILLGNALFGVVSARSGAQGAGADGTKPLSSSTTAKMSEAS
jgi:uncharacterized protein